MSEALEKKLRGKTGIRFFGDVHGCYGPFAEMAKDAMARGLHLHSLGDLINKGPDSAGCMELACDLNDSGWLDLTPGNHCEKFTRWVLREGVKLKDGGLGSTVLQLARREGGQRLADRYFKLVREASLWSRFGRIYAVHGAMLPGMVGRAGPALKDAARDSKMYEMALNGETNIDWRPGDSTIAKRSFRWADALPAGVTVLIGHTVVCFEGARERRGRQGARIIHLDSGLVRGGTLSWIDIPSEVLLGQAPLVIPKLKSAGDTVEDCLRERQRLAADARKPALRARPKGGTIDHSSSASRFSFS